MVPVFIAYSVLIIVYILKYRIVSYIYGTAEASTPFLEYTVPVVFIYKTTEFEAYISRLS